MSNANDDMFQGFEEESSPAPEPRKPRGNRSFVVILLILGGLFLLALIAMAVIAAFYLPSRNATRQQQAAEINAANTATAIAATQVAFALSAPSSTPFPSATVVNTPTAVIVQSSATPVVKAQGGLSKDLLARTQTVSALLTQAALGTPMASSANSGNGANGAGAGGGGPTTTALPATGIMDEIGLPGLLGVAALLVGIIILVRRLRLTSNS